MWLKNLWKNKQKWNIKGEQQTCIWIVLSFYFFRPCWRGIHKLRRGMWLSPPHLLFCSQYLGLGLGLGLHFWGRGAGVCSTLGCFWGQQSSGALFHTLRVFSALSRFLEPGTLPRCAELVPNPGQLPGQGTPALKSRDGNNPWDTWEMVRNPTPWDTDQGGQEPPSLSFRLFPQFPFHRQLSKGWLE